MRRRSEVTAQSNIVVGAAEATRVPSGDPWGLDGGNPAPERQPEVRAVMSVGQVASGSDDAVPVELPPHGVALEVTPGKNVDLRPSYCVELPRVGAYSSKVEAVAPLVRVNPDEGEEITVTSGEELFAPIQYNSFRVGPLHYKTTVRATETLHEAYTRARVALELMMRDEFAAKLRDFNVRLGIAGVKSR